MDVRVSVPLFLKHQVFQAGTLDIIVLVAFADIFVLAVEDFVKRVDGRGAIEVVRLRGASGEPLERTRIPWVEWGRPAGCDESRGR